MIGLIKPPECPYCYDGYIVKENFSGVFYCVSCNKHVKLE